jgi:hypothetical protein
MHFYVNWAKERLDEMDAAVASLEGKAGQVKAESRVKADQLVADLRKKRDQFQDIVKKQTEEVEAAWARTTSQLESTWSGFEADVEKYVDTFGKQAEQQRAVFQGVAEAQIKAWRRAVDEFHGAAAAFLVERRADIDANVKRMEADASEAEERVKKLTRAGSESWTALNAALAESRSAFDRANRAAWDAFRRAAGEAGGGAQARNERPR